MTDELNKEIRTLKMQIAKLQLESKLRRNLASELDKQKQIAKNAEELANEKSKIVDMKADPDDLPKITDIHGNEYDPKKMSDEKHDFAEDDLPDGIEVG